MPDSRSAQIAARTNFGMSLEAVSKPPGTVPLRLAVLKLLLDILLEARQRSTKCRWGSFANVEIMATGMEVF